MKPFPGVLDSPCELPGTPFGDSSRNLLAATDFGCGPTLVGLINPSGCWRPSEPAAGGQWVPNDGHYGVWSARREVLDDVAPGPGDQGRSHPSCRFSLFRAGCGSHPWGNSLGLKRSGS